MFKSLKKLFSKKTGNQNKTPEQASLNEQMLKSINDFKNRPIYKKLTEEIIDETPDHTLLQVVFDNLCEKFPKDYSKEYSTIVSFSKARQAIYLIWYIDAEIKNGGFNQF